MDIAVRPTTPNTVMYDEDETQKKTKTGGKKVCHFWCIFLEVYLAC